MNSPRRANAVPSAIPSPVAAQHARALAWAHTARFLTTSSRLSELPVSELPEIAFVGRSNAGKSSAINVITQQRQLAFASKTPGRTQHINLFELGPRIAANALLADLPGYGYAAVERGAKLRWQKVMADYLEVRRNLVGIVLLVDSRLGLTSLDERLLSFIAPRLAGGAVKLVVVLTKADKLNRRESDAVVARTLAQVGEGMGEHANVSLLLFSATKRVGVAELADTLSQWVAAEPSLSVATVLAQLPAEGVDGLAEESAAPADQPTPIV